MPITLNNGTVKLSYRKPCICWLSDIAMQRGFWNTAKKALLGNAIAAVLVSALTLVRGAV